MASFASLRKDSDSHDKPVALYCDCDILPPHGKDYHDKVVDALVENPNQHFIIKEGVVYLVEPEDLIRELNND